MGKAPLKGDSLPRDLLLVGEYMQAAISSLLEAIKKGSKTGEREVAVIPTGAAGRGSTLNVDFHSTKPIYPVNRCHLNAMVADTEKWEQSAAFLLDSHPGVKRWVKNDRLGFTVPYRHRGVVSRYVPDFIVVTDKDLNVIIEIKGRINDDADAKAKAAERWVEAVNHTGGYGTWHYLLADDPGKVGLTINGLANQKWDLEQQSANLPLFNSDQFSNALKGKLLQHFNDMPNMVKAGQMLFEEAQQENRDFFQLEHVEPTFSK